MRHGRLATTALLCYAAASIRALLSELPFEIGAQLTALRSFTIIAATTKEAIMGKGNNSQKKETKKPKKSAKTAAKGAKK